MSVYLRNIGTTPYILSGAAPVQPGDRLELTPELCGVHCASDPAAFAARVVHGANANLPTPRLAVETDADEPVTDETDVDELAPDDPPTEETPAPKRRGQKPSEDPE